MCVARMAVRTCSLGLRDTTNKVHVLQDPVQASLAMAQTADVHVSFFDAVILPRGIFNSPVPTKQDRRKTC